MVDQETVNSSTTPTHSSAWLAVKLKKLMEMKAMQVPMSIKTKFEDMDTEDPEKRAQVPTPLAGTQTAISKNTQIRPEVKSKE